MEIFKSIKRKHAYKFIFDRAARIDFWNSGRLGLFDCRPPSYYRLKGRSQLLFRAVGWTTRSSHLELEQLCRITKITHKNITIRQKKIEKGIDIPIRMIYIVLTLDNTRC